MNENVAEQLVQTLECQECGRPWSDPAERWRVYLTDEVEREPIPYCPDCASREFDPD